MIDPEMWKPVFRKDHAPSKYWNTDRFEFEATSSSAFRFLPLPADAISAFGL
jgi:hypothetical protein